MTVQKIFCLCQNMAQLNDARNMEIRSIRSAYDKGLWTPEERDKYIDEVDRLYRQYQELLEHK